MNAAQKVRQMLVEAYGDEGRVNAMEIWRGWHVSSQKTGWHMRHFGRSDVHYLGKSVAEVGEWCADFAAFRNETA